MRAAHAEGARGRAQNALTNLGLKPLCCALRVLGALEAPAPDYVAKHAAALVKLLVRLAKEHAQGNPSLILAPQPAQPGQPLRCAPPPSAAVPSSGACALRAPADSRLAHALRLRVRRAPRPPGGPRPTARAPRRRPQDEGGEPEYGTMVWAMCAALKLAAPRVLFTELVKKQFLQARPRPGRPEFTNLLAPACGLLARRAHGRTRRMGAPGVRADAGDGDHGRAGAARARRDRAAHPGHPARLAVGTAAGRLADAQGGRALPAAPGAHAAMGIGYRVRA